MGVGAVGRSGGYSGGGGPNQAQVSAIERQIQQVRKQIAEVRKNNRLEQQEKARKIAELEKQIQRLQQQKTEAARGSVPTASRKEEEE